MFVCNKRMIENITDAGDVKEKGWAGGGKGVLKWAIVGHVQLMEIIQGLIHPFMHN